MANKYELPPLPYAYDALEPHIDEQTMRLHHDKHHLSYVNGLNTALEKLAAAREAGDYALVKHWSREAAFHGSGHLLHSIFWPNMAPPGSGPAEPEGDLAAQIAKDFGSFEAFKAHFSAAAGAVEGSGWALLVWEPNAGQLEVLTAEKHQNLTQWGVVPLLVLDVWEHAYYLKYQNNRAAYVTAWWNVVNWADVAERFAAARG
jgi:Fe-Mn family superoxide dismutase